MTIRINWVTILLFVQYLLLVPNISGQSNSTDLDSHAFVAKGNAFVVTGALDSAIGCYSRAIGLDSSCAEAYFDRGLALWNKHSASRNILDSAKADYTRALRISPRYVKAILQKASLCAYLRDYKSAVQLFTDALALSQNNIHALYGPRPCTT